MDVLKRKGKNALSSSGSGGCAVWDSRCLSGATVSAVTAARCKPPPHLAGTLTPPARIVHSRESFSEGAGLGFVLSDLRHQVRRQESLT